ncbi:MAG: FtsX-like permease family protein [Luteitalea sp.]|nr:FtsX-like permease family protein [Luteitalea sp.]
MLTWLETLAQDLRYGCRTLWRQRTFSLVAIGSLALGIGATTIIFSAVHAIVLEPFPYKDPDTLVSISASTPGGGSTSYYLIDEFLEITERNRVFTDTIASTISDVLMTGTGEPERLRGNYVTLNTFEVMGVPPLLGRGSTAEDARTGANPIAVLGYTFWQNRFGGQADVLGQQLRLNGRVRTVVGVMPPRFMWRGADVYLPEVFRRGQAIDGVRGVHLMGRLKPGVTRRQVEADVRPIIEDLRRRDPERFAANARVQVSTFKEAFASGLRDSLVALLGAVGLLLLIACANVSNLLLARASVREREMAIRTSLGAGRRRIARQLLTESLVLAVAGGVAGVVLAYVGLNAVTTLLPDNLVPDESELVINLPVLFFALSLSMLSAVVFGLVPALQAARTAVASAMREAGRGLAGAARHTWVRNGLVVTEVALAVVLLVGASLMMRTMISLQRVELTFEPDRILTMRVPLPEERYPTTTDRARFFTALLENVRDLPGVRAAAVNSSIPLYAGWGSRVEIPGHPTDRRGVAVQEASPAYFDIVGTSPVSGRLFDQQDVTAARRVAVVNEAFVARYFARQSPIGRMVRLLYLSEPMVSATDNGVEIIGVVRNVRNRGFNEQDEVWPEVYVPFTLSAVRAYVVVQADLPPMQLQRSVRGQVYAIDKDQPVTEVRTVDMAMHEYSLAGPRFTFVLFAIFASLGLLLATVGVYGMLTYAVTRRTQEIGVRVALGARWFDVIQMVMGLGLRLVGVGLVLGCLGALAASRLLASQLWGVSPFDVLSFAVITALLLAVGLLACFWPAHRAARIDPVVALRAE